MKMISVFLVLSASSFVLPTQISAFPHVVEKKFANCASLNQVYPGGVAKAPNWRNKGGEIKNKPVVNAKVYNENASRDRDKDGIACEN